ncbi:MAG: hypothetical protein AAGH90_02565, partial [Pseudomonadota bacterium]
SLLRSHSGLKSGRVIDAPIGRLEGQYVAGGFGSRGFTFAPWAARVLTSLIFADPVATQISNLSLVDPARQVLRDLKRGQIG